MQIMKDYSLNVSTPLDADLTALIIPLKAWGTKVTKRNKMIFLHYFTPKKVNLFAYFL